MAKVIIMRGLPGVGKSTFIRENRLVERGFAVVSPDTERAAFPLVVGEDGFPVYDQHNSRRAWENSYIKMGLALADGQSVVFDATFMSSGALKDMKHHIHNGEELVVVDFKVDAATLAERNRQRYGTPAYVPAEVIDRMAASGAKMSLDGLRVLSPGQFAAGLGS